MAKRRTHQDMIFGKLVFDWLWEGSIQLEPYGRIALVVDGGNKGEPPTKSQQDVYATVRDIFPEFKSQIDEAILQYYQENREKYLPLAIEPDEEVPLITHVDELDRILLSPPTLNIGVTKKGALPPVSLSWATSFDEEHGLKVDITGGEIRAIGPG